MAIKISGNTVIDDSRNITSSGTMSANAYIGDGSQLTNLPGGGNVLEATASGTLADGSKVIVNADGTVSVVAQTETTGPGVGSQAEFSSNISVYISAAYDSTNNKVVIAYSDWSNSNYGTAVVGTVSGTSISFGTPVVFESANTYSTSTTFDPTNNKVVIAYSDYGNSQYATAVVGTVSGTSISFGTPVVFQSSAVQNISGTFDSTNNKVVIAYSNTGNSDYGTAIVGTVSGTSISFGSAAVFESATAYNPSVVYDSSNQKVVIAYRDWDNSEYGTAIVGTVSGTSISFGSPVVFESDGSQHITATYDSTNNRVVIVYRDKGNSYYGTSIVGTVSGTSISFGSPVVFETGAIQHVGSTFDSASGKVVIAYNDTSNSQYGTSIVGTVDPSNNSITFGPHIIFNADTTYYNTPIFDSTTNKVVIVYNSGTSSLGKASVFSQTGYGAVPSVSSSAIFNSAATYYSSAVYDSTNQKVVIAYADYGNSYYGTAIVGTISGSSISFGSPVVFESAQSNWISATFDSSNGKVVIAYNDQGNSRRGTAIVGTVSGTSISFGSPAIFESGRADTIGTVFDSSNNKVVIGYIDVDNTSYGKAIVGTVSGTSISFASEATFNPDYTSFVSLTYDSDNSKVVISYQDSGNNNRGTAVVATVSGTSISFGSEVVFETGITGRTSSVYDSANGKVVIAYYDQGNSYHGTAVVGTVSGTSISFGSPVVFEASSTDYPSVAYDSTAGKVVISYRDQGNSNYGTVVVGTVSGTSISFDAPTVFESAATAFIGATYDSSNDKVVIAYLDGSNYGTAVVFAQRTISRNLTAENFIGISNGTYSDGQTATIQLAGSVDDAQSGLTPGSKYYVQGDGTLSTSAGSPSVFAGTAVATTKLIVKN